MMPKNAIATTCTGCAKKMRTTRKDGIATCVPCRAAAKPRDPNDKGCKVDGCEKPHGALGYCIMHYGRFKKHGDPLICYKGQTHKVVTTSDGLRICKMCGEAKPLTEYHRDKVASDGYRAQCKPCRNGYMQSYHAENIERRKEYMNNRMTTKREHVRRLDRARYERNKDKRVALATEHAHIRRARMQSATYERGITVTALRKIHGDNCCYCGVEMDFKRGKRGNISPTRATIEHTLPISKGGSHTWDNTTLACHRCNTSKNAKTVDEWIDKAA